MFPLLGLDPYDPRGLSPVTRRPTSCSPTAATVHLRPIPPEDADALVALHARFSERTRYLRYFSPYPRIPERDLHRFTNVDHGDREALVVAAGGRIDRRRPLRAAGRGAPDAEVAFVVEDAHQGRGIGSVLLEHLAAAARERGISRFVAEVLPENRRDAAGVRRRRVRGAARRTPTAWCT